jgi:hypothetical protein
LKERTSFIEDFDLVVGHLLRLFHSYFAILAFTPSVTALNSLLVGELIYKQPTVEWLALYCKRLCISW